jgi:hypothetical protein
LGLIFVLALAALGPITPAHGASERRTFSPLDARVKPRERAGIDVAPRPLASLDASDERKPRWERFAADHGGDWTIYLDGRAELPTLISGRGITWPGEMSLESLDARARSFLSANASAFGDWSNVLDLDRDASVQLRENHWQLVYRQRVDGVRVENARLDLHVVRGRVVLIGAERWARPRVRGIPAVDRERARDALDAHLGDDAAHLTRRGDPQLVMIAVDGGASIGHLLVWRLHYDAFHDGTVWVGEVDAHDGRVAAFYDGTDYAAIRGGVFPLAPDGNCDVGGCETPEFPMPFADYTPSGSPEQFADAYGNLTCAATFETNLSGPYVRITDNCGAVAETGTCADGVDLGLKAGENCVVAPGASQGNTAAARTAYYQVNRVAEVARFYAPANAWLNAALVANVNVASSCNATWDGTKINMYGAGGNCRNTGENTAILVHEWGHGYDQNDGGGRDRPGEAYSDVVAILTTHASCMGRGTYVNGTCTGYGDTCLTCTGFRDFDWTARQSNTPATPTNFVHPRCPADASQFGGPCNREAHCESYVSSEAIYDLATRDLPASGMDQASAWQLVERLWYQTRPGSGGNAYSCSIPVSNSCGVTSWYQRMRVADDDDGNLANGTPHAAALFAAFQRHAIACGAVGDATNQSTSSCPALATPSVTASVVAGGAELSWNTVAGAAQYRVFRGELGCGRQQVPIASVPAGQTTFVDNSADSGVIRHYRVQAFGSNGACASPVSNCAGAPPGARLQLASHRVVDDGDGTPEPGETIAVPLTLRNVGADAAAGVAASVKPIGPAGLRVFRPGATWPPIPASASAESTAPHFGMALLDPAACGQTVALDLQATAANASAVTERIEIPMGIPNRDYTETGIVIIPPLTTTPAQAQWVVADDRTIVDLDVTLDIFHQEPTQIVVELTSPGGTTVRLHDRTAGSGHGIETRFDRDTPPSGPGTMADFAGEQLDGTWTLSVQDLDGSGITTDGYIRPRTLHATIAGAFGCDPQSCAEPVPAAAPALNVALVPNGGALDMALSWTPVAGAGYHVLQSTDARFLAGVEVIGNPSSATTALTLPDGAHTTPALTFFEVRAVNGCHQEGP